MAKSGRFFFSVPKDDWEQNLDFERESWQMCPLFEFPWLGLTGMESGLPASLIGRLFREDNDGTHSGGTVLSYLDVPLVDDDTRTESNEFEFDDSTKHGKLENMYLVQFNNGERKLFNIVEVVALLGCGAVLTR